MTFDEILQKMTNIEQEIYTLYIALVNLEIKGLEDSEEYHSTAQLLEAKIEEESSYFSSKALDGEWLLELLDFFDIDNDDIKSEYFESSLSEIDIERICIRAYQLLNYVIDTNLIEDEIKVLLPEDKEVNIDNIIKYVFNANRKLYHDYYALIFERKIINYGLTDKLYHLQKAINQEKDEYIKQDLQTIKYQTAYCEGLFTPNITKILAKGPITQITHEQIEQDCSLLKASLSDFLLSIDEIMNEDANDYIDELLDNQWNPASKKALIAKLKATLSYISKTSLETIKETFDEINKNTIIAIQLDEIITQELQSRSYYNVGKSEIKPDVDLQLTDQHIELIRELLNIEHSIYQIYAQIIKLKSEGKENTIDFKNWIENLKDAFDLEKRYLNQIPSDYDYILQLSLAINGGNLHLYTDKEISKNELFNLKERLNSYIEPIFNCLLIKELLDEENQNITVELNKEMQELAVIQFLQKIFMIEAYKKVNEEIYSHTGNTKKELISNQFSTVFTNFHLTDMLLETDFDCNKFSNINSDYLYVVSLELEVDYHYLKEQFNTFMYETALQFGNCVNDLTDDQGDYIEDESDSYSEGYIKFLEAQIKAAIPFLSNEQLNKLGYEKDKTLVK